MITKFIKGGVLLTKVTPILTLPLTLSLTLTLILTGCATVKITGVAENDRLKPNIQPNFENYPITLSPYFTIPKHSNPNLSTKYLDQKTGLIYIGDKTSNPPKPSKLGYELTKSLSKTMGDKTRSEISIKEENKKPTNGLWIKGQMTEEKMGSRALRTIIGLGAGKTKLDTKTFVYNLDKSKKTPWLTIWTSGHSGSEPGAIFSAMPSPVPVFNIIGAANTLGTLVNHNNKGLTQDAKRTGKVIAGKVLSKLKHTEIPSPHHYPPH